MFACYTRTRNCSGISRRAVFQVGSLGLFGLNLPRLLRAEAGAAPTAHREVNCILLWTDGGMSNIDSLDMKPEAPAEYRGEFQPINTNLPGVQVCEHMPHISRHMEKICQLRTIVHPGSQHPEACHQMLTGYFQIPDAVAAPPGATIHPMFGSVVSRELGWRNGLPPNVQLSEGGVKYSGSGYMGSAYNPLLIKGDPSAADFKVEDVSLSGRVGPERTDRRRRMLRQLDAFQAERDKVADVLNARSEFYRQAYDLITSPAAKDAFRLESEPDWLRDLYGRNREGQSTLLARRLIEAGVRFVTVEFNNWDTHDKNFPRLKNQLLPTLDRAWAALLHDLSERGLLESTVVICAGEFGRTPRVNGAAGRDHYPACNVIGFSGTGVAMGRIVGKTDAKCERVVGTSHTSHDYAATIYRLLGIDTELEYHTQDGRPVMVSGGGKPIEDIFS